MNQEHFRVEHNIHWENSKEQIFRMMLIETGSASVKIDFASYDVESPALI